MNDRSRTVRRSDDASCEPLGEDRLVLDLTTGEYYGIGPVGGFIWDRLDGRTRTDEVATAVAEHFGVEYEQAERDLLEFLDELIERGLAEIVRR